MLVRDFSAVVFVLPGSMGDGWEDLSVRSRIASQLISHELPRWPALLFQDLAKEALSGSLVSPACDQDVEHIAVLVHGSPKIMALTADGDEHLVHVPNIAETILPLPQAAGILGSELAAPRSNGFIRYGDATLREKILDIAKAQREPVVEPNGVADDFGGKAVASIQ